MKSFGWRFLICLVPVVAGALIVGTAFYNQQNPPADKDEQRRLTFRLGVDLVGGTILVYEADFDKMSEEQKSQFEVVKLAEKLKRRIDPSDLYNITVRPVPPNRVEIVLPTGGGKGAMSAAQVEATKEKIARVGSLEFLILANREDDREAIEAVTEMYGPKMTTELKEKLEVAQRTGKPPIPPTKETAEGYGFEVKDGRYTYQWVELGRKGRVTYHLDNASAANATPVDLGGGRKGEPRNSLWKVLEQGRATNSVVEAQGIVFYSREVPADRASRSPERDKDKKIEYFVLARNPEGATFEERKRHAVTGDFLSHSDVNSEGGGIGVSFNFNAEGANRFGELTTKNKPTGNFKRHLAIVLDDQIESAPTINDVIRESGRISGNFTVEEATQLVDILRSGALPATLKPLPVAENTIGATLGEETIRKGTLSVLYAFAAVLLFMLLFYRFSGFVACVALLANLLLTVGVMVLINATFTLPGLAGLVLTLGMAVDANILIYERLREERDRGASIALAIRNAYDRSLPTIIDTHLSSIFTAIVLYVVGNDQLKGFGISLTLGLFISLFTSLVMTRLMFDFWLSRGWLHNLSMVRLFSRTNIDFMGIRHIWFTATVILTIGGAALFLGRGKSGLNIDFTGGTLYSGRLETPVTLDTLQTALGDKVQDRRLVLSDVTAAATEGATGSAFNVRYEGDKEPRRVVFSDRLTVDDVRSRAAHLPDFAVELYEAAGVGGTSTKFTVRTSEQSQELLQVMINRLLDDPENKEVRLERLKMVASPPRRDAKTGRDVVDLTFTNPTDGSAGFASEGQVRRLLAQEFVQAGGELAAQAQTFLLDGDADARGAEGTPDADRYHKMTLSLSPVKAADLTAALDRGAREFADRPQPDRLEKFDSTLAEQTQTQALYAIVASWIAILLYLWFRFGNWTFGLAAVLCLIHDLFFTLGIIAACHYLHGTVVGQLFLLRDFKIDLQTVAALLTLVGYSVNDTIVVFDRIREVRGKNPELTPAMINDGVNQALSRTILTSMTVWLVVIVLYIFGGEGVHLFGFVMVVGVIVGTYSSIYIASPLLLMFGEGVTRTPAGQRQAVAVS